MSNADKTYPVKAAAATDRQAKEDRRHRLEAEAKTLSAAEIETRIVELQEELVILQRGPFVEYPKMLPDGRTVHSAEEEAEPIAEPDDPPATKAKK